MAEIQDERLRLLVERYERLYDERKGVSEDMKDVINEAHATGYDKKAFREIVKIRRMKPDDRKEMEALLEVYLCALGME